jgi:hypothetical protein
MTIRIYGATGLAIATGWQTIAVIFRQTVGGGIQVETMEQSIRMEAMEQTIRMVTIGDNNRGMKTTQTKQSEQKQLATMGPAIGGSNQVAGCDRWVTNWITQKYAQN